LASIKTWITRSSIISVAPTIEFASRFLRTVILSRFLLPDEFGTAVAITVVLGTAALVTDVSLDKFAMVNDRPEGLAASHALSLARGLLLAIALVSTAATTASLFGVPQFAGSFAVAAAVPLLGSFAHFGIKQIQRNYEYAPETIALFIANFAAILALILALLIFRDHRAIIGSFLTEAAVYTIASHVLARSPYRLQPGRAALVAALSFGLPLTLNGVGLAALAQLDRVLVGHWFGVSRLATYAVILSVSITPISLVLRVCGTLTFSYLLSTKTSESVPVRRYCFVVFVFSLISSCYALFVTTTLDILSPLIFGHAYAVNHSVQVIITMMAFVRIQCAGAPTTFMLAAGRTAELAIINLFRGLGLVCGYLTMLLKPSFELLLLGFFMGDIVMLMLFFFLSSAKTSWSRSGSIPDLGAAFVATLMPLCMLNLNPWATLQARGTVFGVGLLGLAIQLLVGARRDGPLHTFLPPSRSCHVPSNLPE
jgi:O-antigen/teichoic acid export membrane protein